MSKFRVFIENIRPSIQDLTVQKGMWDVVSYSNGWRHARTIITKKPVPVISGDVEGDVYDAGKDNGSRLSPMYEKFRATSFNRYLPIGNLKDNMTDDEIKAFNKLLDQNPNYDLLTNNCEDFARALVKQIIDGSFPTRERMRGAVFPGGVGSMAENLVKIVVEAGFEDAVIYDLNASLTGGLGPKNIDDEIKNEK